MYRVTHDRIVRSSSRDGGNEPEVFESGDTIEPTEDELRAFGDRLEEIDDNDKPSPNEILRSAGIDPDDYDSLRSAASRYEGIDGRKGADILREQLVEKLR